MAVIFILFACVFFILHNQVSSESKAFPADSLTSLEMLMTIINKHAVIITDDNHGAIVSQISYLLERRKQMMFSYHQVHTALVPVMENLMEHASLEQMRDQLQFLVVCELTCVERLFTEIDNLDRVVGQGSLLRHFSTWMIVSFSGPQPTNTTVDNVVWMRVKETVSAVDKKYSNESHLQDTEIHTLLWMPRGREWFKIDQSDLKRRSLHKQLYPNVELGLNGRTIVLSTLQWMNIAIRAVVDGKLRYEGVGFDIMDNLKRKFNFSYVTVEPEDHLWGHEQADGNFSGVLGMLQRKEADMCPVPYDLILRRHSMVDYSSPIQSSEYTLVYKKTPDKALSWLFLASSFSWSVYLCGAGSLLWVTLLVFLIHYSRPRESDRKAVSIIMLQYMVLHIPFRQDIQFIPKSTSLRVVVFTWSLFCLVFAAVYTSNLVAITAVDIRTPPFKSMEELAYQTNYKILINEGVHVTTNLKESNDSVLQTIYNRLFILPPSNISFDETESSLIKMVLSGEYVAIVTKKMKEQLMSKSCKMEGIQKTYFQRSSGLAFPKNSPLRKYFDNQLLYLLESGLIETFMKKWTPKPRNCDKDNQPPSVTVNHLKTCLIMVLSGLLSAGIVLVFERTVGSTENRA